MLRRTCTSEASSPTRARRRTASPQPSTPGTSSGCMSRRRNGAPSRKASSTAAGSFRRGLAPTTTMLTLRFTRCVAWSQALSPTSAGGSTSSSRATSWRAARPTRGGTGRKSRRPSPASTSSPQALSLWTAAGWMCTRTQIGPTIPCRPSPSMRGSRSRHSRWLSRGRNRRLSSARRTSSRSWTGPASGLTPRCTTTSRRSRRGTMR
mmetsp:Transcript_71569/g.207458  ORF Transcript_71569/g.207458 Transcript_71569/m.207458 type:complete len:207 (+) Transcript_71569:934-1554(+)